MGNRLEEVTDTGRVQTRPERTDSEIASSGKAKTAVSGRIKVISVAEDPVNRTRRIRIIQPRVTVTIIPFQGRTSILRPIAELAAIHVSSNFLTFL